MRSKRRTRSAGNPNRPAPDDSAPRPNARAGVWWAIALIALVTTAAYANSLAADFVFDDYHDIVDNVQVRRLWPWSVIGSWGQDGPAWLHPRPVVVATFSLNYALAGRTPWPYHATNLAIHVLAALALFGLVRRTLLLQRAGDFSRSATSLAIVATLLWSVHPLTTQAVTYVAQRYESLMGLFYLATMYCAARAMIATAAANAAAENDSATDITTANAATTDPAATSTGRPLLWQALSVAACLAAMGSKEVAVTAPIMVLLYDRVFFSGSFRTALRARPGLYLGLAACWLVCLPLYRAASGGKFAGYQLPTPWQVYALSQPSVIVHYLRLCFWPVGQCLDYAWTPAASAARFWPSLVALLVLLGFTLRGFAIRSAAGFLGCWFFGILAVTSSVLPIADMACEHRMYLPLAAVTVFVVTATYRLVRRWQATHAAVAERLARLLPAMSVLAIVAMGGQTALRNDLYRNPIALYQDTLATAPHNVRAWLNLSIAQGRLGDVPHALDAAEQGLAIDPQYRGAHARRAVLLGDLRRDDEALAEFAHELKLHDDDAETYLARGKFYFLRDRFQAAADDYTQAMRIAPHDPRPPANRSLCRLKLKQYPAAIADGEAALKLEPGDAKTHWFLGSAYAAIGKHQEAIANFDQALRLNPRLISIHHERAESYRALGMQSRAEEDLATLRRLSGRPTDSEPRQTSGTARPGATPADAAP